MIKGCETLTQKGDGAHHTNVFVEEMAPETLEELNHNQTDALNALELCVAFQTGDEKKILALPRAAVVNSMLWLDRLGQAKRRRSWGDGEVEAMDWGLNHCQRDLIQMCRKTLQEKSKPELIELLCEREASALGAEAAAAAVEAAAAPRGGHGRDGHGC